nr:MAG TPA: hypothetical protein [Caudoviricetes sp.]
MTVDEYRYLKEDWNIPLTEDMEEIERKQKVKRATWAVAEAVYKAIDNLEEDERKALYDDCDDLYDMILEKLGE